MLSYPVTCENRAPELEHKGSWEMQRADFFRCLDMHGSICLEYLGFDSQENWKVGELVSRVLSSCNNDSVQILVWRLLENTALLFLHCSFCGFACFPELTMLLRQSSSSYISAGSLAAVLVAGTASVCHCTGLALSVASVPKHLPRSHHWHSMLAPQGGFWPSRACHALSCLL